MLGPVCVWQPLGSERNEVDRDVPRIDEAPLFSKLHPNFTSTCPSTPPVLSQTIIFGAFYDISPSINIFFLP